MTGQNFKRFLRIPLFIFVVVFTITSFAYQVNSVLAQEPVPTPTPPGQIQLPTATPTQVGGPTATATRTPTLVPVLADAIGEANLRSGPGLDFDIVGQITNGNPVPIVGRSIRYPWYQVEWEDGTAWVFDQLVFVIGDITTIPIVDAPQLPTQNPTQLAIEQTATILIQTPGAVETATATAGFEPTGIFTATPGANPALPDGVLPTFTPPTPINPLSIEQTLTPENLEGGVAPATLIISLGAFGFLTLLVGLVRRLFT